MSRHSRSGQTLIDVLIASGVGAILLVGALSVLTPALRGSSDAQMAQTGAALARGLQDGARSFANGNWSALSVIPQGSSNVYFLAPLSSGGTVPVPGTETVTDAGNGGLVGHWKLDDTDMTTAYNFAPPFNEGSSESIAAATSTCPVGGCWEFDGASSRIIVNNHAAQSIASGTLSAWVKTSYSGSAAGIVAKYSAYGMVVDSGRLGVYDYGENKSELGATINDNQWHHVACVFQDGVTDGTRCYVDGAFSFATTVTVPDPAADDVRIGEGRSLSYLPALIDDVRIYDRLLPASEVQRLAVAGTYTRSFYLEPVNRTSGGAVTPTGGYADASTRMLVVTYRWPRGNPRSIVSYLTRSRSNGFVQGDWAGGSGLTTATSNPGNRYYTGTGITTDVSPGSFQLLFP